MLKLIHGSPDAQPRRFAPAASLLRWRRDTKLDVFYRLRLEIEQLRIAPEETRHCAAPDES